MMPRKKGELTEKQKRFAEEFPIDLNAEAAAKRAGYSEKTAYSIGSELKGVPHVRDEIQKKLDERSERTGITADYVLTTVRDTIERCRQAEPVEEWDPIAKEMVRTGEWKFDANAVLKGCDMLGKHIKLWDQPPKINISVNVNTMTDEEIEEEIAKYESNFR